MPMVYCAYCGKSFTRKEHLERHIPSHTNVKPHRCSACQLSFARRDLLQRHHSTYHEARDPMEPSPGGTPTIAGRTPIACQNCANAKTGCDKRTPCTRCTEKNLKCETRYARRSSKAAVRAAQASAYSSQLAASPSPQQQPLPSTMTPPFMDLHLDNRTAPKTEASGRSPRTLESQVPSFDPCFHGSPPMQKQSPAAHSHLSMQDDYPSPHARMDLDEFLTFNPEYVSDPSYQSMLAPWPDYPGNTQTELAMYPDSLPLPRSDLAMPPFPELSDVASSSGPSTTAASTRSSIHTRGNSILSASDYDNQMKPMEPPLAIPQDSSMMALEEVMAVAETAWPMARCNPPTYSDKCPRTGILHLEMLEKKSREEGTWSSLEQYLENTQDESDVPQVVPLQLRSREMMLAITQRFLQKALDIHRSGTVVSKSGFRYPTPDDCTFFALPPSRILEYFLQSYVHSLAVYYPLVASGKINPNEMLSNNESSILLVLLMIAQGAAAVPTAEARYLSAGLTETCRISLFDIIEKNVELSADPTALRCALLFTLLGAWGGDKWQMDIAMGQRAMYLAMLKHAGMLEPQPSMIPTINNSTTCPELQWEKWVKRESQNRLVYNWVMVDQELSLFHDTAPILSISELQCPLPSPEKIWLATSAEEWLSSTQSVYGSANVNPQLLSTPCLTPSLHELFQEFLHDNLRSRQPSLSPQQLRLLLHPLQTLLCHLRQMLACFPEVAAARRTTSRTITKSSTLSRLEEVQGQLQLWYELSMDYYKANPDCAATPCNLVLYHLISLNAVTNFPEIERLARREGLDGIDNIHLELSLRHKRCIFQREEAIFHSGQVLRLLRQMPAERRPSWWSAAMYRAVLILWVDSIGRLDPHFKRDESGAGSASNSVAMDRVTPEDPAIIAYMWNNTGVAVLTQRDGTHVSLDKPGDILAYGVKSLEDGVSSRLSDGIKHKLVTLTNNWASFLSTPNVNSGVNAGINVGINAGMPGASVGVIPSPPAM